MAQRRRKLPIISANVRHRFFTAGGKQEDKSAQFQDAFKKTVTVDGQPIPIGSIFSAESKFSFRDYLFIGAPLHCCHSFSSFELIFNQTCEV